MQLVPNRFLINAVEEKVVNRGNKFKVSFFIRGVNYVTEKSNNVSISENGITEICCTHYRCTD